MTVWNLAGCECAAADAFSQCIADIWPLNFIDRLLGSLTLFCALKCECCPVSTSWNMIFYIAWNISHNTEQYLSIYLSTQVYLCFSVKKVQTFLHTHKHQKTAWQQHGRWLDEPSLNHHLSQLTSTNQMILRSSLNEEILLSSEMAHATAASMLMHLGAAVVFKRQSLLSPSPHLYHSRSCQ